MNKSKPILIMALIVLIVSACKAPVDGGIPAEPTEAVSPATAEPTAEPAMEPTEEPAATEETAQDTGEGNSEASSDPFDPSTLRYPLLQVKAGSAIVLTTFSFDYVSDIEIGGLEDAYMQAMEPLGCGPYSSAGGETGISNGYLCLGLADDELDDFTFSVGFPFEPEGAVGLTFGSFETPDFDLPIPDDAKDVEDYFYTATFNIASESLEGLFSLIEAQNCEPDQEFGSPEGGVSRVYVCLDDSGKPLLVLSVSTSSGDVVAVSMSYEALFPEYVLIAFPEGAQDFTYGADQTLSFNTPASFEDVYAFFTAGDAFFTQADCTLTGKTGGSGGSTAMQFFCTDYYAPHLSYDYAITVVIMETENGTAVQMTFK